MIQNMRTPDEHARNGRNLIYTGQLARVRTRLGFTRSAMAQLLQMSRPTYTKCEDDPHSARSVWSSTAERLGRFVYLMELTMDRLEDDYGVVLADLMPLHVVALQYGLPQEVMIRWHLQDLLPLEDLGVLGLWMRKDDLHMLDNQDHS